jgi:hypothetical protein
MSKRRDIVYNCRQATFLIEKRLIGKITLREKIRLHIHLYGCSACKLFNKQSMMINAMIKQAFKSNTTPKIMLDDRFKKQLQYKIEEELNKN